MAEEERSFQTTTPEANRAAEQGLGVGAREIAAQRDPGEEPQPGDPNLAIEAADAGEDGPELSLGRAHPKDDEHGPKTRRASKDIISGRAP